MARRSSAAAKTRVDASHGPHGPDADSTYRAVSDSTRRRIIDLLAERGPLRAGDIASHFSAISRPAVSRHLRVLLEAELLSGETRGREHWLTLNPLPLREVQQWVRHYEQYWSDRLDDLARLVEEPEEG